MARFTEEAVESPPKRPRFSEGEADPLPRFGDTGVSRFSEQEEEDLLNTPRLPRFGAAAPSRFSEVDEGTRPVSRFSEAPTEARPSRFSESVPQQVEQQTSRFSEAPAEARTSGFSEAPDAVQAEPRRSRFEEAPPTAKEDDQGPASTSGGGQGPVQPSVTESVAELEATLETYTLQERQVEDFLRSDPSNVEVLKLAEDVAAGIRVTRARIEERKRWEAAQQEATYVAGSYAEAQFDDGSWYTVRILEVQEGAEGRMWRVVSVGYSNTFDVTLDRLRPWHPPKNLQKGDSVEAVHPANGLFFDAVVDMVTQRQTVWVTFKEKNKVSEELPLTHVRFSRRAPAKRKAGDTAAAPAGASATGPAAGERWGEDEERERKKKKRQKLKDRIKDVDAQLEGDRNSWQAFVGRKKPKASNRSGVNRGGSIFTSPEGLAGRVGVGTCGLGGAGMTKERNFVPNRR